MLEKVIINDVGPRDGLQNQSKILEPTQRLKLINKLLAAGLTHIEVGAFVSPKAVPAMAGTDLVAAGLPEGDYAFSALIPNRKGYDLATAAGIRNVGLVLAASNTMNERNINMGTERALAVCVEVLAQARRDGVNAQVYVATTWECPFEGLINASVVSELSAKLLAAGASEIVLADTIGAAAPAQVKTLLGPLVAQLGAANLSCHFHDTRGMGVADVFAALECGIRKFDASIGGLGGCPFAPGATGNVATEDVVLMLNQMGFDTGINLAALVEAADLAAELTGNCDGGHSSRWLRKQIEKGALAA
ncbi:MAG: hydroxymethylglutaryl-CoA lyase [Paracoccaceae bacterium]|jgi:hydroxymethylglutaryl-CoA lyase